MATNRFTNIKRIGGFRSGAEYEVATALGRLGVSLEGCYESTKLLYTKTATYLPDFCLDAEGTKFIEVKGVFSQADRAKMRAVQESNPGKEFLMLFTNPKAKLNKGAKSTYADWCDKHGFEWGSTRNAEECIRKFMRKGDSHND